MKCRNHAERDAVAVCSQCWQPLCHECCISTSEKIFCKDGCEEEQQRVENLRKINLKVANEARRSIVPAYAGGVGLMMLAAGYFMFREAVSLDSDEMRVMAYIAGGLGALPIIGAIAAFFSREDDFK